MSRQVVPGFAVTLFSHKRLGSWASWMRCAACFLLVWSVAAAEGKDESSLPDVGTRQQGIDWPDFLGPNRDSRSPETGIITDWNDAGLRMVWQLELGESYGIGSVSRGRYFQFDRIGRDARLRALHAETGEPIWEFRYPTDYVDLYGYNGGPRCTPLVDGRRVYIFGAEGMLHCLDAETGGVLWKFDTAERFGVVQNFFGVGSNPVVFEDLLIVMVGGSPPESQRVPAGALDRVLSNGTGIVAFDKWTGEVRYATSDELASYASLKLATVGGEPWGFSFARGGLVGFQPRTGEVHFHFPWRARLLESVNASTPVVVGNEVLISETYGVGAALLRLEGRQPQVVWRDQENLREKRLETHWNTPVFHEGYVYASSGRHTGNAELRCVQWDTGQVVWSEPGLTRASLLYVDQHLICLGEDGVLRLLRATPERFDEVGRLALRAEAPPGTPTFRPRPLLRYPCWAAPILAHGLLYVRGDDRLVCLELIPPRGASAE
jgi:outer membrane protein assembly factor BamB